MRWWLVCGFAAAAWADDAAVAAARVAEEQSRLPWFWSASMEGVIDIPYRYEVEMTRVVLDARGRPVRPAKRGSPLAEWRAVRLEVIPLEFGTEQKCLALDGRPDCGPEWTAALTAGSRRRDAMDDARREMVRGQWTARRERWKSEWRAFVGAHRFELTGPGRLRFDGAKRGELVFDAATYRVSRMSYQQGAESFAIDLTPAIDGRMLPARVTSRRPRDGRVEDRTSVYGGYQRFAGTTSIRFEER